MALLATPQSPVPDFGPQASDAFEVLLQADGSYILYGKLRPGGSSLPQLTYLVTVESKGRLLQLHYDDFPMYATYLIAPSSSTEFDITLRRDGQ